jgi:hypothetical protein
MSETVQETKLRVDKIFKGVGYSPHRAQIRVHASRARNRVMAGGRRLGKSEIGAGELDIEAVVTKHMLTALEDSGKRREFWIVGPGYTDSEKEFRKHYDAMKRTGAPFDRPGTYYDAHAGDMQLSMFGGKYLVIGKSAMHPERLVGEGLAGVIMAEAAKQKERTWTKFIRPTLADEKGWSLHTSTPEGKNWFHDLWKRGQDPNDTSWASWRFGSWNNPFVYPMGASPQGLQMLRLAINNGLAITDRLKNDSGVDPEIVEMMLDLSEETFNQEVAALFTEFAGRVFKRFDEEVHVGDFNFDPNKRTYAAVDYGFTNPFVWLLIQEDIYGNVTVLDELYESGLSIDDAARKIDQRGLCPGGMIEFYPDPASPGDTLALERHLKVRANSSTGGELNIRLRMIREALKDVNTHLPTDDPLRHPKLQFDRKCVNTIREMNDYRYPETSKEQKRNPRDLPLDKDNHGPEALGRFYRGRYGDPGATPAGGSRVADSTMSRGRRTRRSNPYA